MIKEKGKRNKKKKKINRDKIKKKKILGKKFISNINENNKIITNTFLSVIE